MTIEEKIIALLETQARCGCWSKMVLAMKIVAICRGAEGAETAR